MTISPTKFSLSALFYLRETSQLTSSLASFSIRDLALVHFLSASSKLSDNSCSFFLAASKSSISSCIWASTFFNFSSASSQRAYAAAEDSLASLSSAYFGLTTFIASSYCTIALIHLARPQAAFDAFLRSLSSYSSELIIGLSSSIVAGEILSLSKVVHLFNRSAVKTYFFAGSQ